jgi:hypothetical protein
MVGNKAKDNLNATTWGCTTACTNNEGLSQTQGLLITYTFTGHNMQTQLAENCSMLTIGVMDLERTMDAHLHEYERYNVPSVELWCNHYITIIM